MTNQIRVNGITYTSPETSVFWAVSTVDWNGYQIAIHVDTYGEPWFDVLTPNPTEAKFVGIEFADLFATSQSQVDKAIAITRPDGVSEAFRLSNTLSNLRGQGIISNFSPVKF